MTERARRDTQSRLDARESARWTTILLASADQAALAPLRIQLERAGHRVVVAEDGACALAAVAAEEPDLVVVDLSLPDIGAVRFLDSLANNGYHGPVVAIGSSGDSSDVGRAKVHCVPRNSSLKDLSSALEAALQRGSSR